MQLNLGRIGPWLSDRLLLDGDGEDVSNLRLSGADSPWYARIVAWISSPSTYSEENRKTIDLFQKFVVRAIGAERFGRICARYDLDFEKMKEDGNPLLSRDFAKIMTGMQVVTVQDIEDLIQVAKNPLAPWPPGIDLGLRESLKEVENSEELDPENFAKAFNALKNSIGGNFSFPAFSKAIHGGMPTEKFSCYYFDALLVDRERLALDTENPNDDFETFVHNFAAQTSHREMNVGMLVPAPKHLDTGHFQFYRVAAKIVTGEGLVSYCLIPATSGTDLKPIRFYRGTSARPAALDAISQLITDAQTDLGEKAFQSGQRYESVLKEKLPKFEVQAGHSLGSTILQKKLVEDTSIREAYLYNGPGVTHDEVKKFNQRMSEEGAEPVKLIIRDTEYDTVSLVGKVHLGYKAPENTVERDYLNYTPPFGKGRESAGHAHTTVWNRETRHYGHEGFSSEEIDAQLHREKLEQSDEKMRATIGPLVAKIMRIFRDFFRWIFDSRAEELKGLHLGCFEDGHWVSKHLTPERLST